MPIPIFWVVIFAAALHASWNAIVKRAGNKMLTTVLVAAAASILAAILLPWLRQPDPASWPFIFASASLSVIYFILVARTYHVADMSETYPVMRGTAPLLVAIVTAVGMGVSLSVGVWIGIVVICAGILSMTTQVRRANHKGTTLSILNAFVIAGYTIIDGLGVRRSGAPAAYTLWIFLITGMPLAAWAIKTRRDMMSRYARNNWHLGMIGGVGTVASYGLALWAMTIAPIAVVAALRETSIIFGMIFSGLVLKERIGVARAIAAGCIALGAAILRLG